MWHWNKSEITDQEKLRRLMARIKMWQEGDILRLKRINQAMRLQLQAGDVGTGGVLNVELLARGL